MSETVAEWHIDCSDVVEIETRCRISIWRTFWRIQWHVIPEPRITLQECRVLPLGEFTVTIPESHATLQDERIPSAILKIVFRHIFLFLMQFKIWRAAAFVSSPIHLCLCWRGFLWPETNKSIDRLVDWFFDWFTIRVILLKHNPQWRSTRGKQRGKHKMDN